MSVNETATTSLKSSVGISTGLYITAKSIAGIAIIDKIGKTMSLKRNFIESLPFINLIIFFMLKKNNSLALLRKEIERNNPSEAFENLKAVHQP